MQRSSIFLPFPELVKQEDLQVSDIVAVTMFLKDLSNYATINEAYVSRLSKLNPPVRVCTEIPCNVHVLLDALAYKKVSDGSDKKVHKRHTMHVQSISHWAPANIGPYSQAVRVSTAQSELCPVDLAIDNGKIDSDKVATRSAS